MFPVGGVEFMVLGALASGVVCLLLARALTGRLGGVTAVALAGLLWSLVVIGLVTLLPTDAPGVVYAEDRLATCSWDIGGPAPDGFWIFPGGQRLLNAAIFAPAGALMALAALSRPRQAWATVPVGLVLLVGYSVGIEITQLELARLDRACDVTDIIDNSVGAGLGVLVGLAVAVFARPWRARRDRSAT